LLLEQDTKVYNDELLSRKTLCAVRTRRTCLGIVKIHASEKMRMPIPQVANTAVEKCLRR